MIINIFSLSRFKKIKFYVYNYIHSVLAKKFLKLVICSWLKLSLLITSPKNIFYFETSIFHYAFSLIKVVIISHFQFQGFFFINFFSNIDSFKVFSYNKVITLIQSLSIVFHIFNSEIYPLVIKLAILVSKAVLLEIIITAPG